VRCLAGTRLLWSPPVSVSQAPQAVTVDEAVPDYIDQAREKRFPELLQFTAELVKSGSVPFSVTQELLTMLWRKKAGSATGRGDHTMLKSVCDALTPKLTKLNFVELSTIMFAMAKLDAPPSATFCTAWALAVAPKLSTFDARGLSTLMFSCGRLTLGPLALGRDLFHRWAEACTADMLCTFTEQGISMVEVAVLRLHLSKVSERGR
jgi:hypothetical protein